MGSNVYLKITTHIRDAYLKKYINSLTKNSYEQFNKKIYKNTLDFLKHLKLLNYYFLNFFLNSLESFVRLSKGGDCFK